MWTMPGRYRTWSFFDLITDREKAHMQNLVLHEGRPEKMLEYLDICPGSVSVMGLMNDPENHVQLLVDEDVLKHEDFGCHPCVNTSSLKMKLCDVMEKFLPAVHHDPVMVKLVGEDTE